MWPAKDSLQFTKKVRMGFSCSFSTKERIVYLFELFLWRLSCNLHKVIYKKIHQHYIKTYLQKRNVSQHYHRPCICHAVLYIRGHSTTLQIQSLLGGISLYKSGALGKILQQVQCLSRPIELNLLIKAQGKSVIIKTGGGQYHFGQSKQTTWELVKEKNR